MKTHLMPLMKPLVLSVAVVSLYGCAGDPHQRAKIGAGVGAVAGAVIGDQVSDARGGPIVGAVVGAIAGGAVGNYMDKQKRELEEKLAQEAQRNELSIIQLPDGSLKVGIASDVSFDVDSAQLKPAALNTYAKIANVLKTYDKTVIHIVGHTDTTGTATHNQALSDNRAASVNSYMSQNGVPGTRLRQEGRGERELAVRTGDNINESRNRRVDVVIKPVVEGNEQAAWTPPPYLGS